MDPAEEDVEDRRVLKIATAVTDARDKNIPKLLLQLQDVLDEAKSGGKQLMKVKQDIWGYDLLEVLSLSLKQDFGKVEGQWQTATRLVSILCNCCVGLNPEAAKDFHDVFLPEAAENILLIARKVQGRYAKMSKVLQDVKKMLLSNFTDIMDSLSLLFSAHNFLTSKVLQSSSLMKMLMTDDTQTTLVVLATIQSANRMKPGLFKTLDDKLIQGLLDEIIYKLSATDKVEVAGSATKTLLVICDSHPPTVELLCVRYRGLRPLLKKWIGKGFERDLKRLTSLLEAGSMQRAETEKLHQAARVIQARWRSHHTRTKLKKANTAMAKFQRSFRSRKEVERQQQQEDKQRAELEHMLLMNRRRAMRNLHQKRLHTIEILPPAEVDKHLAAEQHRSALLIQKTWRGWRVKKHLDKDREDATKTLAAIKIQRSTRRWLKCLHNRRREPPNWQRPPGLTDLRRVELQDQINTWRDKHPTQAQSEEDRVALHERVQGMLKRQAMVSRKTRRDHQRREGLLAILELDSKLLLSCPKMEEITDKDVETYSSYSVPISTKARYNHNQELRLLRQPWWKKLGNEYQDDKTDEELNWKVF